MPEKVKSGYVKDIGMCKRPDVDPRNDAEIIHELQRMGTTKRFDPKDFLHSALEVGNVRPESDEGAGFRKGDIVRLKARDLPFSDMLPQSGVVQAIVGGKFLLIQGRIYPAKRYRQMDCSDISDKDLIEAFRPFAEGGIVTILHDEKQMLRMELNQ